MTRFSLVIKLYDVVTAIDSSGSAYDETVNVSEVFANRFSVGTSTWVAARSAGMHADSEVEVRSFDYEGQQRAVLDGVEYEVEKASDRGEFTRLVLKRRASNG